MAKFPNASHPFVMPHALDGGPTLYVGSPHVRVEGAAAARGRRGVAVTRRRVPAAAKFQTRNKVKGAPISQGVNCRRTAPPFAGVAAAARFAMTSASLRSSSEDAGSAFFPP